MKLTKSKLKQIIREEVENILLSERRIGLGKMSCEDTWKSLQDMLKYRPNPPQEPKASPHIEAQIEELEMDLQDCPEYSEQLAVMKGSGEPSYDRGGAKIDRAPLVKHHGVEGFLEERRGKK